jgi:TM2 domain-containing membrane protein YozV
MNSKEIEYAKIKQQGQEFALKMDLGKQVLTSVTVLSAIWMIFEGLKKVLVGQEADGILAIAKIVEALNLGSILGYLCAIGSSTMWVLERQGKKRAIKQKNKYQRRAEAVDPHRSSSGLNHDGSTPEEEDDD